MAALLDPDRKSHPERTAVTQPGVARNELPWVGVKKAFNSERVESTGGEKSDSTLSELMPLTVTQGRLYCANPGLNDHNPVGVAAKNRLGLNSF
jgi:hypothetical protein